MPTKNRHALLQRAVQSVFSQRLLPQELLIIDDGSVDGTAAWAERLFHPEVSCRYISLKTSRGGAAARNYGISEAQQTYVAFLDDDDWWHPEKLFCQYERALWDDSPDLIYTGVRVMEDESHEVRRVLHIPHCMPRTSILLYNYVGITSTVLIRRTLLMQEGFDSRLPALQEYDLFIRLIRQGAHVAAVPSHLVYYAHPAKHDGVSTSLRGFFSAAKILLRKQPLLLPRFFQFCGLIRICAQKIRVSHRFRGHLRGKRNAL
nr:glycosyltransferase family 2 protein [Chitinivibrio alkaliphilus]